MADRRVRQSAPLSVGGLVAVGCCIGDLSALGRILTALSRERGRGVPVSRDEVVHATGRGGIAGLVYDLEPGDASAVSFVRHVHAARPDWPVWLYHGPSAAVIERVPELACLRGVWATSQGIGSLHEAQIRVHARHLVTSVPRVRLLNLLNSVLRPLPGEVREYLEVSLEHRALKGPTAFRVRNGVTYGPGRLRHLERVCRGATALGPKRLLDRLILVFVTFKTCVFDVPLSTAAQQAGLSPKALDRLRNRILGAGVPWPRDQPRGQFALALMTLAKACRVPQRVADEVVEYVAHARQA